MMDKLDVVGKMPWRQTMQASVDEHSQLEVDAFWRLQPVKVSQHRVLIVLIDGYLESPFPTACLL